MTRNASGTYTTPSNSVAPAVEGTEIDEGDFNVLIDDIESALTDSLDRTGKGKITAYIDFDEISSPASPAANVGRLFVKDVTGTTTPYFRDSAGTETSLLGVGGASNSFATISVSGQPDVVADSATDTLTLVGSGVTITSNATTDTITFSVSGAGDAFVANPLSQFAATTSLELKNTITDETGSGPLVFSNSPTLVTPLIGTPTSGVLTNCTGLPVATGIADLGTGVATFLTTPTSENLIATVTDETGTGSLVFGTSPTLTSPNLVTPAMGTPSSGTLTNCTGLTTAGLVDEAVTYAKIQNVSATDKVLGRSTAGAGDIEEITCTPFARSILDDADAAAVRATIGVSPSGSGDVSGPASATDNAVARFDATTGKLIQNSAAILADTGVLTVTAPSATANSSEAVTSAWARTAIATAAQKTAAAILNGEEGAAFDFLGRTANINDYADVLSQAGRPQDILTVSRASTATYVDRDRFVKSAATNTLRYDYDASTGVPNGVLLEPSSTNLITYSEEFDNASWTKDAVTISANVIQAPTGATTADKIVEAASAAFHLVYHNFNLTAGTQYTASCWVKAAERTKIVFSVFDGSVSTGKYFDLTTKMFTGDYNTPPTSSGSENYLNDFVRIWITFTASVTATGNFAVLLEDGAGNIFYTGNGTSGMYVFGAQVETGTLTSYIPTTSATVTRAADSAYILTSAIPLSSLQGTLIVEAMAPFAATGYPGILSLASDASNIIYIARYIGTGCGLYVANAGVAQADMNVGTITDNVQFKVAASYRANDFAISFNGGAVTSDTSGSIPTVDRMTFGSNFGAVTEPIYISSAAYISRDMTDAELQQRSSI